MALSVSLKRVFIFIIILIGLIIAVPLIAALFVDNDFSVERQIVIDKPSDEVFEYVRMLRNQDEYSKWATMDPNMTNSYTGEDGTVGFISAWEGNDDVGKGEQEIVRIEEGKRIDTKLRFIEPFESQADAYMITESISENQTRVTWGFDSSMPYPMNLMLLVVDFNEAIGEDYQYGLDKLKAIIESMEPEDGEATTDTETT